MAGTFTYETYRLEKTECIYDDMKIAQILKYIDIYWQWICSQIPEIVLNSLHTVFLVLYNYDKIYLIK